MFPAPGGHSKYGEKVNILSIQLHLLLSVILHQKWVQLSFQSQIPCDDNSCYRRINVILKSAANFQTHWTTAE